MKREDLKALGLSDEHIDAVMKLHGSDIEVHKTNLTNLQTQFDGVNKQLGEANTTIEGFKKLDVDAIKAAADDYKAKYEQAQADAAAQLNNLKFDHALESALTGAKAKNPKSVIALLSRDALKLNEDGSILGLKEQLEKIKSENDYLFADEQPVPRIVTGGNNQSQINNDVMLNAARKAAGLKVEG